jgi:hypothetical protein
MLNVASVEVGTCCVEGICWELAFGIGVGIPGTFMGSSVDGTYFQATGGRMEVPS